jgi:hypothetical protein
MRPFFSHASLIAADASVISVGVIAAANIATVAIIANVVLVFIALFM